MKALKTLKVNFFNDFMPLKSSALGKNSMAKTCKVY
jgi:hypothetical protein